MSDKPINQLPLFVSTRQSSLISAAPHRPAVSGGKPCGRLGVCVLGSGSGGNSTVIRIGETAFLVDAGFGPRKTDKLLTGVGLSLGSLGAICLTHLDQDHFRPTWVNTLLKLGVAIYVHSSQFCELMRIPGAAELRDAGLARSFDSTPFEPTAGVRASMVRLAHDREGTVGYRFDTAVGSIGYATDLGHAPPELIEHMAGVDLLCIESNYDEAMTHASGRPAWINRRNMSDAGHLSNEQSYEAVRQIADASPAGLPRDVVLLHRSSQCNHPTQVREVFERDAELGQRIILTEQRSRTSWLQVKKSITAGQNEVDALLNPGIDAPGTG
jgi:phosphoribosyl 1,2-cyclic phosphodiesterase